MTRAADAGLASLLPGRANLCMEMFESQRLPSGDLRFTQARVFDDILSTAPHISGLFPSICVSSASLLMVSHLVVWEPATSIFPPRLCHSFVRAFCFLSLSTRFPHYLERVGPMLSSHNTSSTTAILRPTISGLPSGPNPSYPSDVRSPSVFTVLM